MIYAELITGKIYSQACPNCSFLGYGLISKFKDKGLVELDFGFDFNGKKYKTDEESFCSYNANQKLITTNENDYKLNLFFRTIDVKNSFPGKTNQFRSVGSNWSDDESCSGSSDENSTIKTVITDRNNSFNQTGDGPKYKITLTPSTVLKIREDNKNKNYEDFNFTCKNDGNFCISNYLTELRGNYGLTIHSGSKKKTLRGRKQV
ncbi:MAG: hypothetical protein IJE04_03435 [Bacilli bacterium]|nr:hypothetical protein [Bacilli bacterium]